jgi:zinc transporter ZupT
VTATAKGPVSALALSKTDFEHLRSLSPEFDEACRLTGGEQLEVLERFDAARFEQTSQWAQEATHALRTGTQIPTAEQLQRARKEHAGAPLAIWLGILIDGIPESVVIGAGLLVMLEAQQTLPAAVEFADIVPYTLIAGLFLSNYPEALASSANMKAQNWSRRVIFLMWFSLMVITAVGSGLGYLLAGALDPTWLVFAEGLAAGAMLTMIASAMIPEAVHMGNASAVGLSTLAGFLAAISFKLLE